MDNGMMGGEVQEVTKADSGMVVTSKDVGFSPEELRRRKQEEVDHLSDQDVVGGMDECE